MAQSNVVPDSYSYQPPSYEECMGNQPPRYPQICVGPTGGLHPPPPPPHTYVADSGLSDYERVKREKKKRILTIGLVMAVCIVFLFIILYIKLNLYHEAQRRLMKNHFRMDNMENSYWPKVPERTYHHEYSPWVDVPRVNEQEVEDIQQQLKKFLNSVTPLGFKNEDKTTELNLETETESYEYTNESPTVRLVNETSD